LSLGTPIAILVKNEDQRPGDYSSMSDIPRPSHADYTYQAKYGLRASSGGGRASARETIARVAAGAIAEKWLSEKYGCHIVAWVSQVENIKCPVEWEHKLVTRDMVRRERERERDSQSTINQLMAMHFIRIVLTVPTHTSLFLSPSLHSTG
jgi:chorismate synthase